MKILAIETSCDETSIAIVDGNRLIINRTYSQIKHHRAYLGVHPIIARRNHEQRLPLLIMEVLAKSHFTFPQFHQCNCQFCTSIQHPNSKELETIEAIAVTVGPGLPPALETGIQYAKDLSLLHHLPLIPVNHLEGHIASVFLQRKSQTYFVKHSELNHSKSLSTPYLSLIISGGHTELVKTSSDTSGLIQHELLGQTLDDAAGEVIDKIGRELGLGYPAGPALEAFAAKGNPLAYNFPLPLKNTPQTNLNFSFSGLKTKAIQLLQNRHDISNYSIRQLTYSAPQLISLNPDQVYNFAASFQQAIINALIFKVKRAVKITDIKQLILTGGVSANIDLRKQLRQAMRQLDGHLISAPKSFTGDNAAMIGIAAHWAAARNEIYFTKNEIKAVDRLPNLNFAPAPA